MSADLLLATGALLLTATPTLPCSEVCEDPAGVAGINDDEDRTTLLATDKVIEGGPMQLAPAIGVGMFVDTGEAMFCEGVVPPSCNVDTHVS